MTKQQVGWVLLGLMSALGLGFLLGLARPHPQPTGPAHRPEPGEA